MTEDQRYSLSEEASVFLESVKDLESTLFFEVYLEGDLPSELRGYRDLIEEKLENFKEFTNGKIDFAFMDPKSDVNGEPNEIEKEIYNEGKGILPVEPRFTDHNGESKFFRIWPGAKLSYNQNGITKESYVQFIPPVNVTDLEMLHAYVNSTISDIEYKLASAIRELTKNNKKRIGFLQGHGELNPEETVTAKILLNKNYYFNEVTINDSIGKLDDFDGLIIADPKTPFSIKDLFVIDQFVLNGGKLMVFMNTLDINKDSLNYNWGAHTTRRRMKIEDMLFDYGIKINENYVMDVNCMQRKYNFQNSNLRIKTDKPDFPFLYHVVATPNMHPISKNLNRIALELTNELSFTKKEEYRCAPIISASNNSKVSRQAPLITFLDYKQYGTPIDLNNGASNEITIGASVSGVFKSYFEDKPWSIDTTYTNDTNARYISSSKKESHILVIGNGKFIANAVDSFPLSDGRMVYRRAENFVRDLAFDRNNSTYNGSSKIDNAIFFQNIVDFMLDDLNIISLRNKEIKLKEMDRKKIANNRNFYTIINVAFPTLFIAFVGFTFWFFRKRRYSKR